MSGQARGARTPVSTLFVWGHPVAIPRLIWVPPLVAVLLLGGLVRALWAFAVPVQPVSDFATFQDMAEVIRAGGWWADSYGWVFQGPVYPLLIALGPRVTDAGLLEISVLNVVLQTATIGWVYVGARSLFGAMPAACAAALCALLPGIWSFVPLVAAENLALFLLSGIVALLVLPASAARALVVGIFTGLLVFARPSYLLLPIVVIAVLLIRPRGDRSVKAQVLTVVLGIALVGLPLANANVMNGGEPLPTAGAGWQPWLIYNERATGAWRPAQSEADYPFAGLAEEVVPHAQRKLALQFVLANPATAAMSVVSRTAMTWSTDGAGFEWTLHGRPSVPSLVRALQAFGAFAYIAVMALAVVGVVGERRRMRVLAPVIAPIAYLVLLQVVSEGNSRYHVPVLPLLCMLAGGGIAAVPPLRSLVVIAASLALVPFVPVGAILAVAIAGIGAAWIGADLARGAWWRMALRPVRVRAATAVLMAGIVVFFSTLAVLGIRKELSALDAVAPDRWTLERSEGGAIPVRIGPYDEGDPTPVSYPPAAALPDLDADGGRVGLARTLDGLEPGREYHLYLQLFDPGLASGEEVTVSVNRRALWSSSGPTPGPGWLNLSIPWVADAPQAELVIGRLAGELSAPADVQVRSLHLYPEY